MTEYNIAKLIILIFFITITGLIVGISMSIGTKLYLNRTKRRQRYIELILGKDNEWYQGKKFDFVMAHLCGAPAMLTAWRMKKGWVTKKQKEVGAYAYPMLHKDLNYIKLLEEFKFFVRWETVKMILILSGVLTMAIGYGFAHDWW